jgi:hypothetical protein
VSGHDGGRVNGLSAVPGDPSTYFAASELGGLFKSTNGGASWVHLDGHLPTRTWDVAAAPGGQTVYATSFYDGRQSSLAGIEVSTDGGVTWTHPTVTPPAGCSPARAAQPSAFGIALRPGTAEALVGTNCGIARFDGTTWVQFDPTDNGVAPNNVWDLVALAGGRTYACGDDGLLYSSDGKPTTPWTVLGFPNPATAKPPLSQPFGGFCSLAVSPDEPNVVIAAFASLFGFQEIVVDGASGFFEGEVTFSDGTATGVNWSPIPHPDTNIGGGKARMPFVVTNDRSTVDVGAGPQPGFDLWFGEGNLIRVPCVTGNTPRCTTDTTKWSPQPRGTYTDKNGQDPVPTVHGDMGDVEFDPTKSVDACPTLTSSDGGIYLQVKTTSDCHQDAEFASANAGLHAFFLWGMAGVNRPGDAEHLYMTTQDNGFYSSEDGGTTWSHRAGADAFDVVADPSRFVVTAEGAVLTGQPGTTTMNVAIPNSVWAAGMGTTFRFTDPIDQADGRYWILSRGFAGPPAVPKGLYVTANIDNFMSDVTADPTALTLGTWRTTANVPCAVQVAEFPGGGAQPYVLAGNCNFRSPDQLWTFDAALNSWEQLAVPATTGSKAGFSMFGVDPKNPQRLYAAVVGDGDPRMVRSDTGGRAVADWVVDAELTDLMHGRGAFVAQPQNADGGVVPLPQPTMVAFDPEDPDVIVAGGRESGVFLSSDGGENWRLLTDPFTPGISGIPHLPRPFFAHFDHEPGKTSVYIGSTGRGIWRVDLAHADVAVVNFAAVTPPSEVIIGQAVSVTLRKIITNYGPSSPVDVSVSRTATAPAGSSVSPATSSETAVGVAQGELRTVDETFTITCGRPGAQTFSFANAIRPAGPYDIDPDLSNNVASTTLTVECVVPVAINIKPGGFPNAINLKGTAPVAVLTTRAGEYGLPLAFDATKIDPATVRFGPASLVFSGGGASAIHGVGHLEDSYELDEKTRDGDLDMVFQFRVADSGLTASSTEACVRGNYAGTDGAVHTFFGCDSVKVAP